MDTVSNEYLRNAVMTASPEQLHLMLYDGALRFAKQGISGIERQDWEAAFNGLSRAQRIMLEMLNALNYNVNQELCKRMASLYTFIYNKFVEACANRDVEAGRDGLKILEYQRETWVMLIDKLNEERSQAGGDTNGNRADATGDDLAQPAYGSLSVEG